MTVARVHALRKVFSIVWLYYDTRVGVGRARDMVGFGAPAEGEKSRYYTEREGGTKEMMVGGGRGKGTEMR